jgi:Bacteriophage minor capsid protein
VSITDVINFIKGLGVTTPLYPNAFPASAPVEAMTVEVGQGFNNRGSVMDVTLTITIRAGHPSESERLSQEVIDKLHNLTDITVGDKQFIMIKSQQMLPSYLGQDADGKHYYMNNFRVLAD